MSFSAVLCRPLVAWLISLCSKMPAQLVCLYLLLDRLCSQIQCQSKLQLLKIRRHRLVLVCLARLASAPYPIVLADAPPSAIPALAPYPKVLADAPSSALLALASYPIVLADAFPSAIPAPVPYPIVLADAPPSALPATAL